MNCADERLDLRRERRREEPRRALARQRTEDALDRRQEAHVEHAVGFVEHEHLDVGKVHAAALDVIDQAAGRRDQNVDAAPQRIDLRLHADAAEDRRRAHAEMAAVRAHALVHLCGELARRRQHERTRRLRLRPDDARGRKADRAAAARTRPSCRCRSARRREDRGLRARSESRRPGSVWAPCSRVRRARAAARAKARVIRNSWWKNSKWKVRAQTRGIPIHMIGIDPERSLEPRCRRDGNVGSARGGRTIPGLARRSRAALDDGRNREPVPAYVRPKGKSRSGATNSAYLTRIRRSKLLIPQCGHPDESPNPMRTARKPRWVGALPGRGGGLSRRETPSEQSDRFD